MAKANVFPVSRKAELRYGSWEMGFSDDPNKRCLSALAGCNIKRLLEDECWLVRHTARRFQQREELIQKGLFVPVHSTDYPALDISDIVYELYVEYMQARKTNLQTRLNNIRDWGRSMLENPYFDKMFESYRDFVQMQALSDVDDYWFLAYTDFCGLERPNNEGPYQDRAFVAMLLGNDPVLLAAYDAHINDGFDKRASLSSTLLEAQQRSQAARFACAPGKNNDDFVK